MKHMDLTGCGTALITPFKNGAVDYDAFASLVDRQVNAGIDFLVPLGTTGETPCLEDDERIRVLQIARERSRGLPVVAGGGTNSLQHTIRSMKMLEPHGVDAFLIVVPYYNKPTQEGQALRCVFKYFTALSISKKDIVSKFCSLHIREISPIFIVLASTTRIFFMLCDHLSNFW